METSKNPHFHFTFLPKIFFHPQPSSFFCPYYRCREDSRPLGKSQPIGCHRGRWVAYRCGIADWVLYLPFKCLYIPIDFPLPEDGWPEISLRTYYLITMNARST